MGVAQVQRHAPEQVLWVQAQLAHQSQSLGIGPDQQVRAVVQRQALVVDAPGPPAQDGRGFQQADLPTQLGGAHRSGQTRPATPNDGQAFQKRPRACTFQASQNLRKGVSRTRWCSTGKWADSISRSKVR